VSSMFNIPDGFLDRVNHSNQFISLPKASSACAVSTSIYLGLPSPDHFSLIDANEGRYSLDGG
jgi:hypothetical protein